MGRLIRFVCAAAAAFVASPAAAGCFTASDPPTRASYDNGATLEYVSIEGEVLTYQTGQVVSRMVSGLWTLSSEAPGFRLNYEWEESLPDLATIEAGGGSITLSATMNRNKEAPQQITLSVEILGEDSIAWEDCIYKTYRFRKVMADARGNPLSIGEMSFAPSASIAFETESTDLNDRSKKTVSRLKSLN